MRIVMMGTGPFAVPTLRALVASEHQLLLAISRPPKGRRAAPAPVALAAAECGVQLWTPESVNSPEAGQRIGSLQPDLLVVCDYGEILQPRILQAARLGGINLHGSLLPKYRGAAPVQWAILRGERQTGNSVIQMTPGLDAGPCLAREVTPIDPQETAAELEARLATGGALLVLQVIGQLARGEAVPQPQEPAAATKAPRLRKEDGAINWSLPAAAIHNQVRALIPWPRAFTSWCRGTGEPLRLSIDLVRPLTAAETSAPSPAVESCAATLPGEVIEAGNRLLVRCGDGAVEILKLQPAGKRSMSAAEFLRGNRLQVGDRLGEARQPASELPRPHDEGPTLA